MEPQDLRITGALRSEVLVRSGRGLTGLGERSLHPDDAFIELGDQLRTGAVKKCGNVVSGREDIGQEIRLHLHQGCVLLDHIRHTALDTRHLQAE